MAPAVGFIGLGNMGAHMARNLVKKGHKLVVYDAIPKAVDGLKVKMCRTLFVYYNILIFT